MAYKIQKICQNIELVMFDRNADIGGVWYENRYPRAGCDIPAHAYTYNFALYPDWPRYCGYRDDIWEYRKRMNPMQRSQHNESSEQGVPGLRSSKIHELQP